MASVRRTISMAQRDGGAQNDEAFPVSSSPPKLLYTQNYLPPVGSLAALFCSLDLFSALHRIRMFVIGAFSKRSSRSMERTAKSKGHRWMRAFFHFFVCFMLGVFIGLAPLISVDFSTNFVLNHQRFSFEIKPTKGTEREYFDVSRYRASLIENEDLKHNASLEKKRELRDETMDPFSLSSPTNDSDFSNQKLLIIVTPAYTRPFQAYYLNRFAHTLKHVPPPLLWIVVEMSFQSPETAELLRKTGVMYRHLVCQANLTSIKDRAVHQRNVALSHIEKHRLDGIVYFADDYNMYTVDLFEQIREIRRFGTWPVAMLRERNNKVIVEGPVCNGSQVIGWHTNERSKITRRFHVDMSGFAFNSSVLWDPKSYHRPTPELIRQLDTAKEGFQESTFIEQLVEDESQMEGLPKDCSKVMVWHLHLEATQLYYPQSWLMKKNLDIVATLT
ncbi:hypothetical protein AAC387_Pa02g0791 [Persea americana]